MRTLGGLEKLYAVANHSCYGWGMTSFVIRFDKAIPSAQMISLLKRLHQCQPLLQCIIDMNSLCFKKSVHFSTIHFDFASSDLSDEKLIEHEQEIMLDESTSLWRYRLLGDEQAVHGLAISIHHAICDGSSIHTIIDFLSPNSTWTKKHVEILPEVEKLFDDKIHQSTPLSSVEAWPFDDAVPVSKQTTKTIVRKIKQADLDKARTVAKNNRISFYALFAGVVTEALFSIYDKEELMLHVPVDLRPLIDTEELTNYLGCYIGIDKVLLSKANLVHPGVVDYAKEFNQKFYGNFLMHYYPNSKSYSKESLQGLFNEVFLNQQKAFLGGVAITNLGKASSNKNIKSLTISNTLLGGLGICVFTFFELNQDLTINFSYTNPLMNIINAEKICSYLIEKIESF